MFLRFQKIIQPKSLKIFQYKSFSNDIPRPENLATAGTMSDVYEKILKRLGAEPGYREVPQSREHLLQYQPAAEDLPARTMADSFASAIIPLSSSKNLQDKYVNWLGYARLGKLIQDMDGFAVWVCQQHLLIPNLDESIHLPYTFVTILVDRIDFDAFRPKGTTDIRLSGHVSWVGRSSMEVVVWLEQEFEGKYKKITRALFLMAARNATNTGPAPINPLVPGNDKEKEILAGGEKRKQLRLESQNQSLLKVVPNSYEQALMHDLFIRTTSKETIQLNKRMLPDNSKWMKHCSNSNTIPCFSEYRNAQNTVFGGFIMKTALESSWVSAYFHAKSRPLLISICSISFEKPVHISSFLQMNSTITYTEKNYMVVMVVADILNPSGGQITSNVMYFIWKSKELVLEVIPGSYHSMLWYLMGRRKLYEALTDIKK